MTRLYLPSTAKSSGISPAGHSEWEQATPVIRVLAGTTKTGTTNVSNTAADTGGALDRDTLVVQAIYALPTGIQFKTTDIIWGQMRVSESNNNADMRSQFIARVLDSAGTTVRAVLYAGDLASLNGSPPSEWTTFAVNHQMPRGTNVPVAVNYTTVPGDWLVLEYGFRKHTTGTTFSGFIRLQDDPGAADMPLDETTNASLNPWTEFSTDLVTPPAAPTRRRMTIIS